MRACFRKGALFIFVDVVAEKNQEELAKRIQKDLAVRFPDSDIAQLRGDQTRDAESVNVNVNEKDIRFRFIFFCFFFSFFFLF
jgi:hypothetical protein